MDSLLTYKCIMLHEFYVMLCALFNLLAVLILTLRILNSKILGKLLGLGDSCKCWTTNISIDIIFFTFMAS